MRVLQILPNIDPSYGGPVNSARAVQKAYVMRGDTTQTYTTGQVQGSWLGLPVRSFPHYVLSRHNAHTLAVSPAMIWSLWRQRKAYDLVHIHLSRGLVTLPAAWFAIALRLDIRVQTHGMLVPWNGLRHLVDRFLVGPILRRADRVYVLSEDEGDALRGVHRCSYLILPNAVELPDLRDPHAVAEKDKGLAAQRNVILWAARLHRRKRVDRFVAVCAGLVSRGWHVTPVVAGADEGELEALVSLADSAGLNVHYMGSLSAGQLASLMRESRIFINTASDEPFGMAMLEAAANRVPVVSTKTSRLAAEMSKEAAFWLAEDDDIDDWVSQITWVLNNPDQVRERLEDGIRVIQNRYSVCRLAELLG